MFFKKGLDFSPNCLVGITISCNRNNDLESILREQERDDDI